MADERPPRAPYNWDELIFLIVLSILVAPVLTIMAWATATAAVALKWPKWPYVILSVTMDLVVTWIALRRLFPAVRGWTKKTLRKSWTP